MPPPAATEVAVAQFVPLLVLPLLELDELQAAVSSRPLATAALAAITCLARTVHPSQAQSPETGNKKPNLG
jgi:hypothetical protein